ncbi:MAG: hypothetical protein ACFB6R_09695 [Alphaproteobacteria bacterium]
MVSRFPRRLTAVTATFAAFALGACASKGTPIALDTTFLDERMSAEEAGYTRVFVDVILAACETARSTNGRRYLRYDEGEISTVTMTRIAKSAAQQRTLVRVGPKTVRPVFKAVRKLEVPMVETPALDNRQSLAAMVEPPALYAPIHGEIMELIALVDGIKRQGNVAKVSEVATLVQQANDVCEDNHDVVIAALSRSPDTVSGRRIALGDTTDQSTASVQPVAQDGATATVQLASFEGEDGSTGLTLPSQTRFVTVQTISEAEEAEARIRLFAVRDGLTLDVPGTAVAEVKTNDRLDSLVILR